MTVHNSHRKIILPFVIVIQLIVIQVILCNIASADGAKPSPASQSQVHFPPFVPWTSGVRDDWNFKSVSPDDPNKLIVDEEVKSLVSKYEKGGFATANVADPVKLQTGATKHLFPNYGFYMIGWDEDEAAGKHVGGLAHGLHYCLAVSAQGAATRLYGMSDATGYGKFLSDNGITIKSVDDARLIWLALCDIAIVPWHSQDLMQVSPTDWHLGINELDGRLCYFDFKLGTGQKVVSVESITGPPKK